MYSSKKKLYHRLSLLAILQLILFSVSIIVGGAESTTWVVDGSGSGDFNSIQDAIAASSDGDSIQINAGVYYEPVSIDKKITILGADDGDVIIDGEHLGTVISVMADDVTLQDLIVRNSNEELINTSNPETMSGIYISSDSVSVIDCSVSDCYYAIYVTDCSHIHINGCTLSQNKGGLLFNKVVSGSILDCTIVSHEMFGVSLQSSELCTVSSSTISQTSSIGLVLSGSSHNQVDHTLFLNNQYGTRLFRSDVLCSDDNIFYINSFIDNDVTAYDECSNLWYLGHTGNYWDDYTGDDVDNDGIGDQPYLVPFIGADMYPLMDDDIQNISVEDTMVLVSPTDGMTINGSMSIKGFVVSTSDLEKIIVQVGEDQSDEYVVEKSFDILVDSQQYENGNTTITVDAVFDDGGTVSESIDVIIDNEKMTDGTDEQTSGFTIIILVLSVLFFVLYRKKIL